MESLSETIWDVVISDTGLQNSLLALALSRSEKKILHVDSNEYYGGTEAAFSLQEVDEWVEKVNREVQTRPFRNASLFKADADGAVKLSFSRAYTLTLSPQIIYTKSRLLAQLVSSKVYRQLEFQAVGNWWILDEPSHLSLRRLPNGREDIFLDKSIDNRAKRSLMKFLKFVVNYEAQEEVWKAHADSGLAGFLSSQFQLPSSLQTVIAALTLSLDSPDIIPVKWALPRISRHLTSIGVFGPGFGAVVPKWGGGAEISQVACRAGAVGGGVYVLGTGVKSTVSEGPLTSVELSNGETVKTKYLAAAEKRLSETILASKMIAIISSPLTSLFKNSIEGAPLAAVSVVVFPPRTIIADNLDQVNPIYIMVHSSETGECPAGQCVLYATMLYSEQSKAFLESALSTFLKISEGDEAKLLYSLYYEQAQETSSDDGSIESSLDLAFNDDILDVVEAEWKIVLDGDAKQETFMKFEDRQGAADDDDADEVY